MRAPVLVVLALLAAGCTSPGADPTPDVTPTPSPTPSPTPEPSPEPTPTPTSPTPTPTPTPTPSPTPPVTPTPNETVPVNVSIRHDYANASENVTFTIPVGAPADLDVEWQFDTAPTVVPGQYATSAGLRIKVIRPDGSIHVEVISTACTGQNVHCGGVVANTGPAPTDVPPGQWHAAFEGQGVGIGWVRVAPQS